MPEMIVRNIYWQEQNWDIIIDQGKITELVSPQQQEIQADQEIDGQGQQAFPSLIDCHVHLRDPGQEYKEDIVSGLQAAAAGGFGAVMTMANTCPINDNRSVTEYMLNKAKQNLPEGPCLHPIGALSKGLQGKELTEMLEMAEAGCKAFSNDGLPVKNNDFFRRAIEYASDLGLKVIDHCEDMSFAGGGSMNEGKVSADLGLKGIPVLSESLQVARDILMAEYLNLPIHLAHISCAQSVELIYQAKKKGIPVTAETCPHYLLWDESLVKGYNPLAKVNPPLRTPDDVQTLRQAVREGILDILVTDHAPHADFEKEVPFAEAMNGLSGLDTAWGLTFSLVKSQVLSLDDLLRLWCAGPAKIFNLDYNAFKPGSPANFFLFEPQENWLVTKQSIVSKGKNTPCLGSELPGKISKHFLNGKLIFTGR